jgi:hypothetical protein
VIYRVRGDLSYFIKSFPISYGAITQFRKEVGKIDRRVSVMIEATILPRTEERRFPIVRQSVNINLVPQLQRQRQESRFPLWFYCVYPCLRLCLISILQTRKRIEQTCIPSCFSTLAISVPPNGVAFFICVKNCQRQILSHLPS